MAMASIANCHKLTVYPMIIPFFIIVNPLLNHEKTPFLVVKPPISIGCSSPFLLVQLCNKLPEANILPSGKLTQLWKITIKK